MSTLSALIGTCHAGSAVYGRIARVRAASCASRRLRTRARLTPSSAASSRSLAPVESASMMLQSRSGFSPTRFLTERPAHHSGGGKLVLIAERRSRARGSEACCLRKLLRGMYDLRHVATELAHPRDRRGTALTLPSDRPVGALDQSECQPYRVAAFSRGPATDQAQHLRIGFLPTQFDNVHFENPFLKIEWCRTPRSVAVVGYLWVAARVIAGRNLIRAS